eukprot:Selendium_serpulae@DN6286_c0_g1_i14.p3
MASQQRWPSKDLPRSSRNQNLPSAEQEAIERDKKRNKLFPSASLTDLPDMKDWDKQAIIRFPHDVASKLRERLNCEDSQLGLGLTITPLIHDDFRAFDVDFEGRIGDPTSVRRLKGALLELPTLIESYKVPDDETLFKSANISQIIYVYDPSEPPPDLEKIKNEKYWEWSDGLTPGCKNIRTRNFRDLAKHNEEQVQKAEQEILEVSHCPKIT